ncbi:MAG: hypothetical protein A3A51_03500 [Candidatus Levybacteria bacterium RIFCSPLOWO2_01_FULL_39_10]|nr:MAG: hypothetical protein A3A51_03500 [Candidatus Levybacteria bacterium RIFCSPLOWO2_01_FULL_39_10]
MSTRKVRLVSDSISGLSINEALDALSIIHNRGTYALEKAIRAAVSNAVNNSGLDKRNLVIKTIDVNEGQSLKRYRPSTRGRVHPYERKGTNLRVVLEDKVPDQSLKEEKKKSSFAKDTEGKEGEQIANSK